MNLISLIYITSIIFFILIAPIIWYFFKIQGILGYTLGCIISLISFYLTINITFIILPISTDIAVKIEKKKKLLIISLYVLKFILIALTIWWLSSTTSSILGFIIGFSIFIPILLIVSLLNKNKLIK